MRKMSNESGASRRLPGNGSEPDQVPWDVVVAENEVSRLRKSPRPNVKNPLGILMAAYVAMIRPPVGPGDIEEALVFRLAHDALLINPDDTLAWALVRRIARLAPEEEILANLYSVGYAVD